MLLHDCYTSVVSRLLHECYRNVTTRLLHECYKSVTGVLRKCYRCVTGVLLKCYRCVTEVGIPVMERVSLVIWRSIESVLKKNSKMDERTAFDGSHLLKGDSSLSGILSSK
jgi:hypothetical protein